MGTTDGGLVLGSTRRSGAVTSQLDQPTCSAMDFDSVDDALREDWLRLRAGDAAYRGPFFHPAFAGAVHRAGMAVTVVVAADASGRVDALWPVHVLGRTVRPVGWPAADFQGPIGARHMDGRSVLTATGARLLRFDHLAQGPASSGQDVGVWRRSPYLDVSGGLEGYLSRVSRTGRDNLAQARRRAKRAAGELGELRFTESSTSHALLDELIRLKRQQYAASGTRDYFADPRRERLLHDLLDTDGPDFRGVLSAVHCGDTLLAAHLGMQSGGVLHWWFPVYEPAHSRYGPGWLLLRALVDASPAMDVDRIDLGRGEDEYKRRAMTGEVLVGEGLVTGSSMTRAALALRAAGRDRVRRTGAAPVVRRALRRARAAGRG